MTDGTIAAPAAEAGVIVTADSSAQVSDNDALGAVWDRQMRDNGSARDAGGKFTSASQESATGETGAVDPQTDGTGGPLEGGEGEGTTETDNPASVSAVPLPATLTGLDDIWAKIPPEAQADIAANQQKLHKTLSDQGRFISTYRPVGEVFNEFKEYFGGDMGNYKPDEAVRHLFGLQRSMDKDPMGTLMQIADTYELRPVLAKMFGASLAEGEVAQQQPDNTQALLAEIGQLKRQIAGLSDPATIDQRINQKFDEERTLSNVHDLISRTSKDMPLYVSVEPMLPTFIEMAWARLDENASPDAALKLAYDMAVNADPDLRKKAAALSSAAQPDPKAVENARKANAANIRSTSTGASRDLTEEELMGQIWDKHKRA